MAKHDSGRATQAWKEPPFAGLIIQDGELHGIGAAGEALQINFGAGTFWFNDAIYEEAGDARSGQDGKKQERQNSGKEFGVPACGIT
jgi:hypothetical protein